MLMNAGHIHHLLLHCCFLNLLVSLEPGAPSTANAASRWYYFSDSTVQETDLSRVLKMQAYILFYERDDVIAAAAAAPAGGENGV